MEELRKEMLETLANTLFKKAENETDNERKQALLDFYWDIKKYIENYDRLHLAVAREMSNIAREKHWENCRVTFVDDLDIGYQVNARVFEIGKEKERDE